jgi:hypothetical protein
MDYMGISLVYTVTSFIVLVNTTNKRKRVIISLIALFSLFFLGSRADLIGFIVFVIALEFFKSRFPLRFSITLISFVFVIGILLFFIQDIQQYNRTTSILNLSEDSSYNLRMEMLYAAFMTIINHTVFGEYASL